MLFDAFLNKRIYTYGQTMVKSHMSSKTPKVTVILPVYNAGTTLKRAVDSVLKQTFHDFELLIVDNNSTDRSLPVSRESAFRDNRIRIFKEPKQGVTHAFNKGLQEASSPYIARMDADDEMLPHRLLLQHDFLQENPDFDAVAGLAEYVPHHQYTRGFHEYVAWSNSLISAGDISLNRFVEMPVINPTTMWRRSISDHLGAYREGDFPEDYEMWLRWMEEDVRVGKVIQPVLRWHDSEKRLTRTEEKYSREAFHRVRVKYLAKYLKRHNPFHPEVWVWGAARQTRRMAEMMKTEGVVIKKYIDVVSNKQIPESVLHHTEIPKAGSCFILVYTKNPTARKDIVRFLHSLKYKPGIDYLLVG